VVQAYHAQQQRHFDCLLSEADAARDNGEADAEVLAYLRMAWAVAEAMLCFASPGAAARAAADRACQMRERLAAAAEQQTLGMLENAAGREQLARQRVIQASVRLAVAQAQLKDLQDSGQPAAGTTGIPLRTHSMPGPGVSCTPVHL
jgi:hypothetical protein